MAESATLPRNLGQHKTLAPQRGDQSLPVFEKGSVWGSAGSTALSSLPQFFTSFLAFLIFTFLIYLLALPHMVKYVSFTVPPYWINLIY